MSATITERDAKEFLVSQIAAEAERQGHPLSDLERKMLYFSESGWTIPDALDVSDAFDREYDTDQYERKIAGLVRAARKRATGETATLWIRAADKLAEGDHYISIMLGEVHPWRDKGSLIWHAVVLLVAGFAAVAAFVSSLRWYLGHSPTKEETGFYGWVTALALASALGLVHAFGGRKLNRLVDYLTDWVFGDTRRPRDDSSRSSR
jgi:hypothetical protein